MIRHLTIVGAATALLVTVASVNPDAHRPVVSPYTYYRDVRPILERRCGTCHNSQSVASSFMQFADARLQTWAMRQALVSGSMPPWFVDRDTGVKAPDPLSTQELNVLMTWAAGGAPEGVPDNRPEPPTAANWPLGQPDLLLTMRKPFTMAAGLATATHVEALAHASLKNRRIRAIDIRPGAGTMVRRAQVSMGHGVENTVVTTWQPGDFPADLDPNVAFTAPQDGRLRLRVEYQRRDVTEPSSDRSQVGVYFASAKAKPARLIELAGTEPPAVGVESVVAYQVDREMSVLGFRPIAGPELAWARVTIVEPNQPPRTFARFQFRSGWERRYMLVTPMRVRSGSRVEVATTPPPLNLWTALLPDPVSQAARPLRIELTCSRER